MINLKPNENKEKIKVTGELNTTKDNQNVVDIITLLTQSNNYRLRFENNDIETTLTELAKPFRCNLKFTVDDSLLQIILEKLAENQTADHMVDLVQLLIDNGQNLKFSEEQSQIILNKLAKNQMAYYMTDLVRLLIDHSKNLKFGENQWQMILNKLADSQKASGMADLVTVLTKNDQKIQIHKDRINTILNELDDDPDVNSTDQMIKLAIALKRNDLSFELPQKLCWNESLNQDDFFKSNNKENENNEKLDEQKILIKALIKYLEKKLTDLKQNSDKMDANDICTEQILLWNIVDSLCNMEEIFTEDQAKNFEYDLDKVKNPKDLVELINGIISAWTSRNSKIDFALQSEASINNNLHSEQKSIFKPLQNSKDELLAPSQKNIDSKQKDDDLIG